MLVSCMLVSLCAADFAMPESGPVAFRRDRVPLSAGTMAGLSRNLEVLARGLAGQTAAERQAAARMLALAMVLDPANARARELLAAYRNGSHKHRADPALVNRSHARIWQIITWLESPDAGTHGNALADCIKDVMVISDSKHPRAVALHEAGEQGAWTGWVHEIEAYERRETAARHTEEPIHSAEVVAGDAGILLEMARVSTVMWQVTGNDRSAAWVLAPASLRMAAKKIDGRGEPRFSIVIGSDEVDGPPPPLAATLDTLMRTQHGPPPQGIRILIYSRNTDLSSGSGKIQPISAAAAVLASAAITGCEPEAMVIGHIDESGTLGLPTDFWDLLLALGPGKGHRLVLPAAAADWLPSFLALENPGFFMDHEVLLADDFQDLLDLTAKEPDGAVAEACVKFREIRERMANQEIGAYLANRFVRQRLQELSQAAPYHASAAMLLLQGAGNRPPHVSRAVLASELRRAIGQMAWIRQIEDLNAAMEEGGRFSEVYKSSRLAVDRLERYAARTDLDLWESARALTAALWSVTRTMRRHGDPEVVRAAIDNASTDFKRYYREVDDSLARAAGGGSR